MRTFLSEHKTVPNCVSHAKCVRLEGLELVSVFSYIQSTGHRDFSQPSNFEYMIILIETPVMVNKKFQEDKMLTKNILCA